MVHIKPAVWNLLCFLLVVLQFLQLLRERCSANVFETSAHFPDSDWIFHSLEKQNVPSSLSNLFFFDVSFFFFQGWKRLCCLSLTAAVFTHLGVQPSVAAVRSHFCWTSSKDQKNSKCQMRHFENTRRGFPERDPARMWVTKQTLVFWDLNFDVN